MHIKYFSSVVLTCLVGLLVSTQSLAQDTLATAPSQPLKTTLQAKKSNLNPYSQLVSLAFKGKGANGIDSYEDAAALYCKSARDDNDANALFALGWMYANGKGVIKDGNIATLFFKKAASQNHLSANKWLANNTAEPSLATMPKCMLPDPRKQIVEAPSEYLLAAKTAHDAKPFYVKGPIYKIVSRVAPQYKIDTNLVMAFIKAESNFNPKATSPKNAQGLMQLIPATSARFNVKDPYDPEQNIKGGLSYLQWLLAYFEGDVRLVAAAYNAGENAVDRYKGIPPYPETKKYVNKIYRLYQKSYHPYNKNLNLTKKSKIIRLSQNH